LLISIETLDKLFDSLSTYRVNPRFWKRGAMS
jgi:hypothetical protein